MGHTQLDFCDFMTAEARRGVAQAADKLDLLHQQQRDQQQLQLSAPDVTPLTRAFRKWRAGLVADGWFARSKAWEGYQLATWAGMLALGVVMANCGPGGWGRPFVESTLGSAVAGLAASSALVFFAIFLFGLGFGNDFCFGFAFCFDFDLSPSSWCSSS